MPVLLELPDELAESLEEEASELGISLPQHAVSILRDSLHSASTIHNGSDLVAFWKAQGLVGTRRDIADSQAEARTLRNQAEKRGD